MNFKNIAAVAALLVAVSGISYAAGKAAAPAQKKSTMWAANEIVWEEYAPGVPLKVAKLWGDRSKGEYGMLLKLPAGFEAGMHAHSADYHGVNVAGTWQHWDDGDAGPKDLPVGSYVMQPGKMMHNDKCASTEDCIFLITQKAKGDYIPKDMPKDVKKTN